MEVSEKLDCSCRLCDETSEKMFGIFEKNEEGIQILQLVKECLPIIIYRTDPLSKQICESCYYNLNSLSAFKKNALKTAENQKDKLKTDSDPDDRDVQLYLGCGEDMLFKHKCKCGVEVDTRGYHGLSCRYSAGHFSRHQAVNDVIKRALGSANIPFILEPLGTCSDDGKRPDGNTLIPWRKGKPVVWDFTCVDTLAPCHVPLTSVSSSR